MTNKLFETEEEPKKSKNFWRVGKWEKSGYNQRTILSAIIKEIRIGNPLMSLYRTHILLHAGGKQGRDYVLKRLAIESSETFIDIVTKNTVNSVMNMCYSNSFGETDAIYHLVLLMSTRGIDETMLQPFTTWRESRLGLKFEMLWTYLEGITPDIFSGKIQGVKPGSYVFDQHTSIGKKAHNLGLKIDNRFSGSTDGRRANLEIMLGRDISKNPINTNIDFPISQDKEIYKTIYDLEELKLPFNFPKNVKEVKEILELNQQEFNKEIINNINVLEGLGHYRTSKT